MWRSFLLSLFMFFFLTLFLTLSASPSLLVQHPSPSETRLPLLLPPLLFPLPPVLRCLLPSHLIIFHPDAMLLMNSIKSSFVTVWKTHTKNGSILCSDTLRKQSLDTLCVLGRPEKTFFVTHLKKVEF